MFHLTCIHGYGFWHIIVDAMMILPFIGYGIFWIKSKFRSNICPQDHNHVESQKKKLD